MDDTELPFPVELLVLDVERTEGISTNERTAALHQMLQLDA
mgnify:FL=1